MGISIKEVLTLDIMKQAKLSAGEEGLGRMVESVSVIEVLDDISGTEENQLLITTAYGLKDNPEQISGLVTCLVSRNLAGLAIQTGYYIDEIPLQIIEECNKYNFPLLELPKALVFAKVTESILKRIINQQVEMLEFSQKIRFLFTDVVLKYEGLPKIAQILSELIGAPVRILDQYFNLLACHGLKEDSSLLAHTPLDTEFQYLIKNKILADTSENKPVFINGNSEPYIPSQILQALVAGNETHGYISIVNVLNPLNNTELATLSAAVTTCTLELLKEKAVRETEERLKGDLLDDLLENNDISHEILHRRATYLGYDLSKSFTILYMDIDNFTELSLQKSEPDFQELKHRLLFLIRFTLQSYGQVALTKYKGDKIIVLLQIERSQGKTEIQRTAEILRKTIKSELNFTLAVGIGVCCNDMTKLPQSMNEAHQALNIGKKLWKCDYTVFYEDLGIYSLFANANNSKELTEFYKKTVSSLLDYDKKYASDLLSTLEAFLQNNAVSNDTSKQLFIHRHTLRYRLNKIAEITGLDPKNSQDRLSLQLGLLISNIMSDA